MNGYEIDEFDLIAARDHWLPAVSTEAVAAACEQIGLGLTGDKNWASLATEVRRSLAATLKNRFDGPDRLAPSKIREELERSAGAVHSASEELNRLSDETIRFLFRFSLRDWDCEKGTDTEVTMGTPDQFQRLKRTIIEMGLLSKFLRSASNGVEVPKGPWKNSEIRALRIERGIGLAGIFEVAFGLQATANNYPSDPRHKEETPFMKFYQQMVALAFNERTTPDLSGVLKEACSLHKARGS